MVNDPRLPPGIKDGMKNVTALVNNMQGELNKDAKVLQGDLKDLSKDPAKALQNAGKDTQTMEKNLENSAKGVKDLFGGNKTPTSKPK